MQAIATIRDRQIDLGQWWCAHLTFETLFFFFQLPFVFGFWPQFVSQLQFPTHVGNGKVEGCLESNAKRTQHAREREKSKWEAVDLATSFSIKQKKKKTSKSTKRKTPISNNCLKNNQANFRAQKMRAEIVHSCVHKSKTKINKYLKVVPINFWLQWLG